VADQRASEKRGAKSREEAEKSSPSRSTKNLGVFPSRESGKEHPGYFKKDATSGKGRSQKTNQPD